LGAKGLLTNLINRYYNQSMDNSEDFKKLMRSIVIEEFPSEIFAFDISSDELIKKLYQDGNIETTLKKESQVNFMEQAMAVLGFIGVLISTYKAIIEIKGLKLKNKIDDQTIEKNWMSALQDSGLSKEEINKVVSKHIANLSSYLCK
jgi:hypothetical protein